MRTLLAVAAALVLALPAALDAGQPETTKIKIGKAPGGTGFHLPSYIAMDHGFFKAEGLEASWAEIPGRDMVNAALLGNVDFVPVPSGGALAALRGADIRYVVGQALRSQWTIVTPKSITTAEQLRGKTIAYARLGDADYDEGAAVLGQFFQLEAGRDYKVTSIFAQSDRMNALINGSVQAALLSIPHAVQAAGAGMHILIQTGDYIPRAGGCFWGRTSFIDKNPDVTRKFIRAIAKAVMYLRSNKAGSIDTLKKYLGIESDEAAGLIWDQLHNTFGAEVPRSLFRAIFESRRRTMIAAREWPANEPLPDPEFWLMRDMLESTLRSMHYVPVNMAAPAR